MSPGNFPRRVVLGAIFGFGKALTVAKLLGALEPEQREVGKCEGRKSPISVRCARLLRLRHVERSRPFLRDVHQLDAQPNERPAQAKNLSGSCVFYVRGDDE
jgi:hypothetical protein